MEIFKIIGVAFVTAITAILLKSTKPELSFAVTVTGVIVILVFVADMLQNTVNIISTIASLTGIENGLIKILLKIVGVGYLTEFSAGILNDFGSNAVADKVILGGKLTILILSLPIIERRPQLDKRLSGTHMTAHKNGFFGDKDKRLPLRRGRGKRKKFKIVLAFFSLFFFAVFGMSGIAFAYAEESADGKEELNQNIIDQIDKLDTEELQKYIDSLGIFSDKNIGERLFDYIRGEKFDYGSFGEQILGVLFEDVKNMLPAFACICAVALLCGILSSVRSSFADQSSADIIFLVAYAAALIPGACRIVGEWLFPGAGESIASMQKQMQIVFPLL